VRTRKFVPSAVACVFALAIGVAGCTNPGGPTDPGPTDPGTPGPAPGGGYENGPAPTAASAGRARGSFAYTTRNVNGSGFNSGVLYTPSTGDRYGAILLIPPFMVNSSALAPQAQLYASNGFVVLAMNANTTADFPAQRAQQGRAALTFLKTQAKVDASRIGVGGYSMGGGATMEVVSSDSTIKAGVPWVPWNIGRTFPGDRVPTLIIGASGDTVAPMSSHARPFYNSIPSGVPKGLVTTSGSHFMPSTPPAGARQLALSWMKYFVDGDTRYRPLIAQASGVQATFASLPG
jgi:pimeloyl-ACP methyl ester carboxylesterase